MRRILLATGLLALSAPVPALAGGVCHGEPRSEVATANVVTDHACFDPVVNRVDPGTTVTWRNDSAEQHNLVGNADVFGAHDLGPGSSVRIRFDKPDTFPYACTLHPGMIGVVLVSAPAAAADTVAIGEREQPWTRSAAAAGGAGAGVLGLGVAAGFALARRRDP